MEEHTFHWKYSSAWGLGLGATTVHTPLARSRASIMTPKALAKPVLWFQLPMGNFRARRPCGFDQTGETKAEAFVLAIALALRSSHSLFERAEKPLHLWVCRRRGERNTEFLHTRGPELRGSNVASRINQRLTDSSWDVSGSDFSGAGDGLLPERNRVLLLVPVVLI